MKRTLFVVAVLTIGVSACTSDPTSTEEYMQLVLDKADVEGELAAAQEALADAETTSEEKDALLSELQPQLSELEDEVSAAQEGTQQLEVDLATWKEFSGTNNDDPFFWTQEYFELFVQTCQVDGTSEEGCVCLADRFEAGLPLMDLMYIAELLGAAEAGIIPINPITEMPEGAPADLVGFLAEAGVDCFS